ncbi:aldehyde dehydrogenase [Pseudaestuariivita atlantica]|uniref:Aldehyde dehydrogenase n=1 Tax=Pseudaestuariivita atlantica TaxID=1317121 RepID=A0A0L1JNB0_9RHOB|nr:aldehyde dehydrogenase [Pseudaestuariivita atlantica]KNG93241.1 aldehyde dehydrogenase [Pseudaestuariivita atlantica]
MTDLLTRAEYAAIAADLDLPRTPFIDGKFRAGSGPAMDTLNPATGERLATIATAGPEDVDLAVLKAREAFDQGHWSRADPGHRKEVLIKLVKYMTRRRHELAVMESLDSGKPIRDCEGIDLPEAMACLKWHAETADKIYDQTAPAGDDAMALVVREPIGVVAAVLPWNFPLLMLAWKIGPALAAGCSVIVKPAEQTSMTALRIAELAHMAGVPRGVLQVLPGDGPSVGEPLGRHMHVDMVTFTGSTETGKRFLTYAGESNLKKVTLECGGKNPAVVLEDAENLDHVAEHVVNAAFWNMGENCSAASRLIVHKAVKAPLMERIEARLRDWKTGDPLDPANHLGALIDAAHCKKVVGYLAKGDKPDGPFITPKVYEVDKDDPKATDEIFGPILSVITVASTDEAIAVANDTSYGLTASVFTSHARTALRAARDIRAGTVTVNCYGEGNLATPFGGYKQSGFGGRDNGMHAHDQYTELKTIWIDLSDPKDGDNVG